MKNNQLTNIINEIQVTEVPIWKQIAKSLKKPTRNQPEVNVGKIEKYANDRTVIVPGKVLGTGKVTKKITVAALNFSEKAKQKIAAAGGSTMTILECKKKHADGKKLVILT